MPRARGLPGVLLSSLRCRGRDGTLKPESESFPAELARETGVGLRIVKETFSGAGELDMVAVSLSSLEARMTRSEPQPSMIM